ncbi:hypothetical protein AWV80_16935 [Cupriavidus sp. UYMU48A]|nr:hypothetical protein AWV80_16935 [Cupriavidus sp. UYMU48A]
MKLAKRGVSIRWVKVTEGRILLDDIKTLIDERTRLVSISAVQFANGFKQDLAALSELCVSRNVLLNVDAIQWVGSQALDLSKVHVDFLSFGGHKWLLAPIGTGVFYCNRRSWSFWIHLVWDTTLWTGARRILITYLTIGPTAVGSRRPWSIFQAYGGLTPQYGCTFR